MNEFQEQGWIDIPMLTKLNAGGGVKHALPLHSV